MGQQMVDKFMGFRVVNSGSTPPTGDKQHTSPVKKVPLRELSNETQNMIAKAPATSLLSKDKPSTVDSIETRNLIAVPPGSPGKTLEESLLPNETHNITKSPATSPLSKDRPSSVHSIETRNLMTIGDSPLLNETQNIAKSPAASPLSKDRPSTVHSVGTTNLMTIPHGSPAETKNVIWKTLGGSLLLNETQNIAKSQAASPLSTDSPSTAHSIEIRNLTAIPWRSLVETRNAVSKTLGGSLLLNETQNITKSPATSPPSKDNALTEHSAETRNLMAVARGSPVGGKIVGNTLGGSLLPNETENIEKSPDTSLPSKNSPLTVHSAETKNLMDIPRRSTTETWNSKTMNNSLLNETQNIAKPPATSPLSKDIPSTVHSVEATNLMAIPRGIPVDARDIVGKTLGGSSLLNETPNIAKSQATSPLSKDFPSSVHSAETRNFMAIPQGSPGETWSNFNFSKTLGGSPVRSLLPNENQNIAKSPASSPLSKDSPSTVHSVQIKNRWAITQGSPNIVGKTPRDSLLLNGTLNIKAKSPATSPLYKDSPSTVHSVETRMAIPRGCPPDTRNIVSKTMGDSPLSRDSMPALTATFSGRKRKHTDSPSSPSTFQQPCNIGASGPLVYVRRKLDTEPCKFSISEDVCGASSCDPKTSVDDRTKEPNVQNEEIENTVPVLLTTTVASRPNADQGLPQSGLAGKAVTGLSATLSSSTVLSGIPASSSTGPIGIPAEIGAPSSGNLDWKERFNRLQMFLKSCDESSQENYITKLRSLSAAGRNQLAVDLEKRAIQLLVDEGIELHRMKVLNVLGKALPNESLLTHNPSLSRAQFERGDNLASALNESLLAHNPSSRAQFERGDNLASALNVSLQAHIPSSGAQFERCDNLASAAKLPQWRN